MAFSLGILARGARQDQLGGVETGLGGIAGNHRCHRCTRAVRVIDRPDTVQGNLGSTIENADPGCVQQRITQTHSLPAQIGRNLIEDPAPLHRGIVADQPLDFTVKTLFELAVILDPADLVRIAFPDFQRCAARKQACGWWWYSLSTQVHRRRLNSSMVVTRSRFIRSMSCSRSVLQTRSIFPFEGASPGRLCTK